ncbi:malonate decarboxylase acyl carrier protein [Mycobacterium simiae]|uniref:malonate decarboxylase acyl carrier protein n=1 Tax=Mycobacterium simiae TaxID=1784 RepID=UPI000408070F|nr:malonate decarboxylase acyl carrier protein [Mycobacterium simiae]PLV50962.1 malonate decarboxylase subunit delta [Mycobacterium tuberculosis variant microti OV254]BBX43219.1 malonate decarboxylase acyl carrier protein [Mycobacterium simiae]
MPTLNYEFPATQAAALPVHVGVVASGDLEILLRPPGSSDPTDRATVRVRTSVTGFDTVWRDVLERFFAHNPVAGRWELNDAGATPGVVALRLRQTAEAAGANGSNA